MTVAFRKFSAIRGNGSLQGNSCFNQDKNNRYVMTNSSINLARPSGLFLRVETLQPVDAVLSNPALREVHLYATRRPTVPGRKYLKLIKYLKEVVKRTCDKVASHM